MDPEIKHADHQTQLQGNIFQMRNSSSQTSLEAGMILSKTFFLFTTVHAT